MSEKKANVEVKPKRDKRELDLIGKHFGPAKIDNAEIIREKTYLGNPMVHLTLGKNDKGVEVTKDMPLEMAEKASTGEPTDLTQLRDLVAAPLVEKVLSLVVESGLTVEDIDYAVVTKLKLSLNDVIDRASSKLWGKDKFEVTFMDMEKVLTKDKDEPNTKTKEASPKKDEGSS